MRGRLAVFACVVCAVSGCAMIAGLGTTYGARDDAGDDAATDDAGPKIFGDGAAYDGPLLDGVASGDSGGRCASSHGPSMVELSFSIASAIKSYCIDSTEVTNAQYADFLNAKIDPKSQPSVCAWNTYFAPNCGGKEAKGAKQPVDCVDWCDAVAFCTWAGKRLCGRIGGGANGFDAFNDPGQSQWFAACSRGGARTYSYGDTLDPGACVSNAPSPADVASFPRCEGGFPGLFDLSGNVDEWEDSCEGTARSDLCRRRGGDILDNPDYITCDQDYAAPRDVHEPNVGIRCCRD